MNGNETGRLQTTQVPNAPNENEKEKDVFIIEELKSKALPVVETNNTTVIAQLKTKLQEWTYEKKLQSVLSSWLQLPWKCFLCGFKDYDYAMFQRHFGNVHSLSKSEDFCYQCVECDYIVRCYAGFVNHVRYRHHPELTTKCDVCGLNLRENAKLSAHREYSHMSASCAAARPEVFYCISCGRAYPTKDELMLHCEHHAYICEMCDYIFAENYELEIHKVSHFFDQLSCVICEKMFKTSFELESHMKLHFPIDEFPCRLCKEVFSTEILRKEHEREQHTTRKPIVTCSQYPQTPFMSMVKEFSDSEFKKRFRVKREIVSGLIKLYSKSDIFKNTEVNRSGRRVLNPDEEMYIFLWYLASEHSFHTLYTEVGVSHFSTWKAVDRVANFFRAIEHNYVKWPTNLKSTQKSFQEIAGIPGVVGVIFSTDINIVAPSLNNCYQKTGSINLQAVVNANKIFMDIYVGKQSSDNGRNIFCRKIQLRKAIGEKAIILGNSPYQCTNWLITPYKNNESLSSHQKMFNLRHATTRAVAKNAFDLLRKRFKKMQFISQGSTIYSFGNLVQAACIIHNICISNNDILVDSDDEGLNVEDEEAAEEALEGSDLETDVREEIFQQMKQLNLL